MTKVAVLSDVHGNVTALAATIADAKAQGADEFWFLGSSSNGLHTADTNVKMVGLPPHHRNKWLNMLPLHHAF